MVNVDGVRRYRLRSRYLWPAFGPVLLGFWIAACLRKQDLTALPIAIVLAAALTGAIAWATCRRVVTMTVDELIVRSLFDEQVIPWSSVQMVHVLGPVVSVTTADGLFALPVPASTRADGSHGGGQRLDDAVWSRWAAQPGSSSFPPLVVAWRPPLDIHGRRVLRNSLLFRLSPAGSLVGSSIGITLFPVGSLTDAFLAATFMWAAVLSGFALYNLWARVTIDDEAVTIRSFTSGRARVLRRDVLAVTEVAKGQGWWAARRLVLVTPTGPVTLGIPATRAHWFGTDPLFYRKWVWLQETLVARVPRDEPIRSSPTAG